MHYSIGDEWAYTYTQLVKALSGKYKDDPVAKKIIAALKKLEREAYTNDRGRIWIPEPDSLTGHYPKITDVSHNKIRTAVRANTSDKIRKRMWKQIAAKAERFIPSRSGHGTLSKSQRESLLRAAAVAFPKHKGRIPEFLGKMVPGEVDMRVTRSMASQKGIGKGIESVSPMKFNQQEAFYYQQGQRDIQQYGLGEWWKDVKWRVGNWWKDSGEPEIKHRVVPMAARSAMLHGLATLNTDATLPPVLVDGIPVGRTGLDRGLADKSSDDLRRIINGLQDRLKSKQLNHHEQTSISKLLNRLKTELTVRQT